MSEQAILRIFRRRERPFSFFDGITVLYGLEGESEIICTNRSYPIDETGIILLNPFDVFRLDASDGAVLEIRISRAALYLADWDPGTEFHLYVRGADERYNPMRRRLAELFVSCFAEDQDGERSDPRIQNFLQYLIQNFSAASEGDAALQKGEATRRLSRVLQFIEDNWNRKISLSDIAKGEFLSTAYLSRFFKQYVGMSFTDYLRELRFQKAARMLSGGRDSITDIAMNCGFQSPSAFTEGFHSYYGVTPRQYRADREADGGRMERSRRYKDIDDSENDMSSLLRYLPEKPQAELPVHNSELRIRITRHALKASKPRLLLNIGYAKDGLMREIQDDILRAQREIDFKYVRFHGIFDEDMHIYHEEEGTVRYDFTRLVMLTDFLVGNGLKPYIELGFLPPELAVRENRIFDRPSVISACADLKKWSELVDQTIRFLIRRYGIEEVRDWRFTAISMNYAHLKCMTMEEYKNLYQVTCRAVRSVDPSLLFGGPGCLSDLISKEDGLGAFLDFAQEKDCLPDFLTFQSYPSVDVAADPLYFDYVKHQQYAPSVLSRDPDYLAHALDAVQEEMDRRNLPFIELFCEEFSSTLWQRDLSSDTCYKSAWIVKNLCENMSRATFGYWTLSDLLEERAYPGSVFHGGYGLLTYNGIPKAGYYGLMFCSMMKGVQIGRGDGWMMVRDGGEYRLLLYHYCHYSTLYCYRYQRLKDPRQVYDVFEEDEICRIQIHIEGLEAGTYRVERQKISKESGSAFSEWIRLGAPEYVDREEEAYLRAKSVPDLISEKRNADPDLVIEAELHPLEVELIRLHTL
jgi:xylan 1,4-beta-xylosidase